MPVLKLKFFTTTNDNKRVKRFTKIFQIRWNKINVPYILISDYKMYFFFALELSFKRLHSLT